MEDRADLHCSGARTQQRQSAKCWVALRSIMNCDHKSFARWMASGFSAPYHLPPLHFSRSCSSFLPVHPPFFPAPNHTHTHTLHPDPRRRTIHRPPSTKRTSNDNEGPSDELENRLLTGSRDLHRSHEGQAAPAEINGTCN